ncbi:MAG: HAMP domain-containing sensor histidine kinase [Actinomycetota bacterium]|nr:HAMP domain-containing sensor histidine kinase [Actinomycetota bacterium]
MKAVFWFLGAVVVGLVLFEISMQPTGSDRAHLALIFLAVTALAVLSAVVVAAIARRSSSIRRSVLIASVAGLLVAAMAMALASQQMFLSAHDLSLVLVVLVFAGITTVGFSVLVGRTLTRDLEATAFAAQRVQEGDLSARTGVTRPDEIGTVAETFDRMAADLELRDEERRADEAARRRFLAAIGHDLRTPLASLRAAIEALEDGLSPDPDRYMRAMDRDISILSSLVDDLFLLAKLEEGSIEVDRGPIDVTELADEAIEVLAPIAVGADVRLELDADHRTIATGGSEAVSRVLRNLLDNAIRFAPSGSTVVIEVRDDGGANVRVLDQGPGFDPEFVDDAFDRFTRDDPARGRSTGGSGLGLAIARGFIEALDGTIWAEPGPGGRVGFYLPAARAEVIA